MPQLHTHTLCNSKTYDGEGQLDECSPAEVKEAGRTSAMIELDLPKLRINAFECTPAVAGAVGDLVDADVEGRHRGKPASFVMVY